MVAADILGSYCSLAHFHNMAGILVINGGTRLGASGAIPDFQNLKQVLCQMMIDEEVSGDGPSIALQLFIHG